MKNKYEVRGDVIAINVKLIGGADTETLIDASDFHIADRNPNTWWVNGHGYVESGVTIDGTRTQFTLHRWLLPEAHELEIDHINRDPLDNRRGNLRPASRRLNGLNRGIQRNNTSGYRGVTFHKRSGSWVARLQIDGKCLHLGNFPTPMLASVAYETAYAERLEALTC